MDDPATLAGIADTAAALLREHSDFARLRAVTEPAGGWDQALWHRFATDLGFAGLAIPESCGGAGMGPAALAAVAEILGGALAPIPWFETAVLAAGVLTAAGSDFALAGIAAGHAIATLIMPDHAGNGPVIANNRLCGDACCVPFGAAADIFVIAARDDTGITLAGLPRDTPGITVTALVSMDVTRPLARVQFDGVDITPHRLAPAGAAAPALHAALRDARLVLAAEAVGGMRRSLDETIAYARQRVQFGRVIGGFQAIKHRLADMKSELEAARSALAWGLAALHAGGGETECAAALAFCAEAYHRLTADAIQLHGGIGFTWDHHAHLFFKRARGTLTLLGTPGHHRETLAAALLDTALDAA